MKSVSTLLAVACFLLTSFSLSAQNRKIALVEQVTSASCGPCAQANPGFDALLDQNEQDLVVIKYQRGGGSYIDPMWDFNPDEVNDRVTGFYLTYHFPNVWINGTDYGSPNDVNQTVLDEANAQAQRFDIQLTGELSPDNTNLHIEGEMTALEDFQENQDVVIRAYVAVIEREVLYDTPPGLNGEQEFHWVMRKMYDNGNGFILGKQLAGDKTAFTYDYTVDLQEIDPANLEVIAWVQHMATKEVFQAYRAGMPSGVTSIADGADKAQVRMFPNPANNQLTIVLGTQETGTTLDVLDGSGRVLISDQQFTNGQLQVATDQLAPGMYFARWGQNVEPFVVNR